MAYSIELVASRRGKSSSDASTEIELQYQTRGALAMDAAVTQILADAPLTYTDPVNGITLVRDQLYWEPLGREMDGTYPYSMRVMYVDPSRQDERRLLDTGEYKMSFDTTGGTAKFTTSKETVATFVRPDAAVGSYDFGQAINVSGNEVQGIDVVIPAMKFTVSYRQPKATITDAYIKILEDLTGTVNSGTFYGRAAGEVLFLGASGSQGTASDPQIDYHFLRSRNITGQTIGEIVNVAKKGHEVLWCVFADEAADEWIVKSPLAVKIERVYDLVSFAGLGIGGT